MSEDPLCLVDDMLTPCSSSDNEAIELCWKEIPSNKITEPLVTMVKKHNFC